MRGVALTVRDICDALMLLPPTTINSTSGSGSGSGGGGNFIIGGINEDVKLAVALQRATDVYVASLRANPPPGEKLVTPLCPANNIIYPLLTQRNFIETLIYAYLTLINPYPNTTQP